MGDGSIEASYLLRLSYSWICQTKSFSDYDFTHSWIGCHFIIIVLPVSIPNDLCTIALMHDKRLHLITIQVEFAIFKGFSVTSLLCRTYWLCLSLGLRAQVAQVRVIFDLPAEFGQYGHPLAYVHWYTPLRSTPTDLDTNMFTISKVLSQSSPACVYHSRNKDNTELPYYVDIMYRSWWRNDLFSQSLPSLCLLWWITKGTSAMDFAEKILRDLLVPDTHEGGPVILGSLRTSTKWSHRSLHLMFFVSPNCKECPNLSSGWTSWSSP